VNNTLASGYRLVDIKVIQFTPSYLFTGTYVADSGSYQKVFWWYYGVDEAGLNSALAANNARLIALDAYDIGAGQIRFTAVMVDNTGADAIGWYWYYNQTVSSITTLWQTLNTRLVQVHSYQTGGQTRYAIVMVDNTGANNRTWFWWVNASVSDLINHINTDNARLIDLDRDASTGNYNAVLYSCSSGCPLWWWYVGVPIGQLLNTALQDGARIMDATAYPGCGGTCFDILLINDSNAITSRVGEMLRNGTDGTKGLFLKQITGSSGVLANLMDSTPFEPASTIKAAVHLYTIRQIQAGAVTLATGIPKYVPPVGSSCPGNTVNGSETIATANQEMMWHSDNTRTRELVDFFGGININTMMAAIGMANSSINHVIGCAGPIPNQTTLDDLSRIYEGAANGSLVDAAHRSLFFQTMAGKGQFQAEGYDWTGLWTTDIPNLISQEAPADMHTAMRDAFRNQIDLAYKAGNYKICGVTCATYVDHISIFGYASIPFCDAGGPRQFVFGTYIYNSTSDASSSATFNATKAELLREQIHAGLASCDRHVYLPKISR
jgi:hypothetical protein